MTSKAMGVLVGAYERDNFGDILFLDQTRHYLRGVKTIATAPVPADTTPWGGDVVDSYLTHASRSDLDFLWTVGGEVGGTSVAQAYEMARQGDRAQQATPEENELLPGYASPYLPRPTRFPAFTSSQSIINSVGLSAAKGLTGLHRVETWQALHEATFISVRDSPSSSFLNRLGIEHEVAPDLVHSMRLTHEVRDELRNVALVQAKVKFIHEIGIENFARALLEANSLKNYHIRFFSAGEAPGHDSTEILEKLASKVNELSHGTRADVSIAKTAREKFDEISRCGLWIGTSLHGYIISTSFGVPRIGLFIEKLNRYASTWRVPYPTGVKMGDLDRAVEGALASGMNRDSLVLADELATRADQNARKAVEFALRGDDPSRDIELAKRRIERMTPARAALERSAKSLRDAGARFYHSVRGN